MRLCQAKGWVSGGPRKEGEVSPYTSMLGALPPRSREPPAAYTESRPACAGTGLTAANSLTTLPSTWRRKGLAKKADNARDDRWARGIWGAANGDEAVAGVFYQQQFYRNTSLAQHVVKPLGLACRHQRVLGAVDEQKRWILRSDVSNRAGFGRVKTSEHAWVAHQVGRERHGENGGTPHIGHGLQPVGGELSGSQLRQPKTPPVGGLPLPATASSWCPRSSRHRGVDAGPTLGAAAHDAALVDQRGDKRFTDGIGPS